LTPGVSAFVHPTEKEIQVMKTSAELFERPNTKRRMIGDLCEAGRTKRETFNALRPLVENQTKPMIFSSNAGGHRTPKPMYEQLIDLKNEIGRVYAIMGRSTSSDFDSKEITPADVEIPENEPEEQPEEETSDEPEVTDGKPKAKHKQSVRDEIMYFVRRVREIRAMLAKRAEMSEAYDELGNRPAWAAGRLIPAGIPADALLDVMTFHWDADIRNDAGISSFDFKRLSRQIAEEREIDMSDKHELFPYILTLVEERVPVMLVGPMGTGKSFLCAQIADYLNLPYGETACSAGATRGDFYGRLTANPDRPFILSKFSEIHSGGGVFNFEEIDAALPEILIALNNALAGDRFFNSSNGEEYKMHPDFIAMATANTWGTGASRMYNARERLDGATLDRWRMGRVLIELDERIEMNIALSKLS
jgi:hypothetical protein